MNQIIEEYPSTEYGISAVISKTNDDRYSVSLRDDDCGEYIPLVYICATLVEARFKAFTLV